MYVIPEYTFGFGCVGEIKLSDEHLECVWLTYEDACNKLEWDSNRTAFADLVLRGVPAILLSRTFLGATGIWCAWPIGWTVGTALSLIYYRRASWDQNKST